MLIIVYFLVLAERPLVFGQDFTPLVPIPEQTTEIVDGSLSSVDFLTTEQATSVDLLSNETVTDFLAEYFTMNGQYGELESGAIVEDWAMVLGELRSESGDFGAERLADTDTKNFLADVSSDQLEAAYASWWRQQQDRRDSFLENSEQRIESREQNLRTLIQDLFDWESGENGKLKDGTVLQNSADWEVWARKQGLPAAGLALMALYATVRRRRELEDKNYDGWADQFATAMEGVDTMDKYAYNRIYQNVSRDVYQNRTQDLAAAVQSVDHLKPGNEPVKSVEYQEYEALVTQAKNHNTGSVYSVYSSARYYQNSRRYDYFHEAGRQFYLQALALEASYQNQVMPESIRKKVAELKALGEKMVVDALNSYQWYGLSASQKQRAFQISQQSAVRQWTQEFLALHTGMASEIETHQIYQTQQAAYEFAKKTAEDRVNTRYRTWATQLQQFWNDQREKASLALRQTTQLQTVLTKIQDAFTSRQAKAAQELERKTVDFFTTFDPSAQRFLLEMKGETMTDEAMLESQKQIEALAETVKNLENRQKNLRQERQQKLADLAVREQRSLQYASQRVFNEPFYSYNENARRFGRWSSTQQRSYELDYQQRRMQAQSAYFAQRAQIQASYAQQKTQLEHQYNSVLPDQLSVQITTAQTELDQTWTKLSFTALATESVDFFVDPATKFPPISDPVPQYTEAEKTQIWSDFQQKQTALMQQKNQLLFLETGAEQSYKNSLSQAQTAARYYGRGRLSSAQYQYWQTRLRNYKNELASAEALHRSRQNHWYWQRNSSYQRQYNSQRGQLFRQIEGIEKIMKSHDRAVSIYASIEANQQKLANLEADRLAQRNMIAQTETDLETLKDALFDDKTWFKSKVESEYQTKVAKIRADENDQIRSINGNTYSYYQRWGSRYYREMMQKDIQGAREAANKRIQALTPLVTTLREVTQAEQTEQADLTARRAERDAQVAFYTELQTKAAEASKAWQYVQNLHQAADESAFFAAETQAMSELYELEQAKSVMSNELRVTSDYQQKIAALKQKLAQPNDYSYQEFLSQRKTDLFNGHIPSQDSFTRTRAQIGRSSDYWGQKHARYVYSIGASHMGYNPSVEQTLKYLAAKAHEERLNSYNGWQSFYRVHPLEYHEQRAAWQRELDQLEAAEAQRQAQVKAQLQLVDDRIETAKQHIVQNHTWLNQSADERADNQYTDEIVVREIELEMKDEKIMEHVGAQDLVPEQSLDTELSASALITVLSQQRTDQQTALDQQLELAKPVAKTLGEIQTFDASTDRTISHVVSQMHYWDSAAGQTRKDAMYNNQAIQAGISKNNTVHYAGGSYAAQQAAGGIAAATTSLPQLSGQALLSAVKDKLDQKRAEQAAQTTGSKSETDLQRRVREALEAKRLQQALAASETLEIKNEATNEGADTVIDEAQKLADQVAVDAEDIAQKIAEKKAQLVGVGTQTAAQIESATKLNILWETIKSVPQVTKEVFENLYEPLEKAGQMGADAWWAYKNGEQGFFRTLWQQTGAVAKGFAGFFGKALEAPTNLVLETLGITQAMEQSIEAFLGTDVGAKALQKLTEGQTAWDIFKADNPNAARDLEALVGVAELGLVVAGGKDTQQIMKTAAAKATRLSLRMSLEIALIKQQAKDAWGVAAESIKRISGLGDELAYEVSVPGYGKIRVNGADLVENADNTQVLREAAESAGGGAIKKTPMTELIEQFLSGQPISKKQISQFLGISENMTGHSYDLHLGKSDDFLQNRANEKIQKFFQSDPNKQITELNVHQVATVSSIKDRPTMVDAVHEWFNKVDKSELKKFLEESRSTDIKRRNKVFELDIPVSETVKKRGTIGTIYRYDLTQQKIVKDTTAQNLRVVLSPDGQGSFFAKTILLIK